MKIDDEIKSRFPNALTKVHVNIIFTSNQLSYEMVQMLKPFGLSPQQYNILRILRGQNGKAVPLKLLSDRMLDRMSNTSRLVDKLVSKNYVERSTRPDNRRQVDIVITEIGLSTLEKSSKVMDLNHTTRGANLTEEELNLLSDLLDKFRG